MVLLRIKLLRATSRFSVLMFVLVLACRNRTDSTRSFVDALRCGMTRDEVTRLARQRGYNNSDPTWLDRSAAKSPARSKELLDLTFHGGKLVAVREGVYDPPKKKIEYRTINLCGG